MGGRRRYTMQDLVEKTGFKPRTIRSYISKGLVPRIIPYKINLFGNGNIFNFRWFSTK